MTLGRPGPSTTEPQGQALTASRALRGAGWLLASPPPGHPGPHHSLGSVEGEPRSFIHSFLLLSLASLLQPRAPPPWLPRAPSHCLMILSAHSAVENLWLDIPVGPGSQILGYKPKLSFLGDFLLSRPQTLSRSFLFLFFFFFFFLFRSSRGRKKKPNQKTNEKATPPPFYFQKQLEKKNITKQQPTKWVRTQPPEAESLPLSAWGMASNSIFDSFPNYTPTFIRGEYQ